MFSFNKRTKVFILFASATLICIICKVVDLRWNVSEYSERNQINTVKPTTNKNHANKTVHRNADSLFYVNTPQCRIPYVFPFRPELLDIYDPDPFETCTNESDLITPIFDANRKRYLLHINKNVATELLNSSTAEYNCFYNEIIRAESGDRNAKPLPRKYFTQDYVVPLHVEGLLVECHLIENTSHVLQRDAFYLVQHKVPRLGMLNLDGPRKPSVIMFGIDSFSRINFRRTMPKVFEHLSSRSGWYEMQGYNKIDDNTFPNLLAILTGYTPESVKEICDTSELGCFDRLPFIWKHFKEASYLTAYAEDESNMGTFNYLKPGFQKPPVDFYFRPFLTAIESNLDVYRRYYMRYCVGRRLPSSYIYDFCRSYMQRFVDDEPIFGLFWTNSFSHDDYSMPAMMDDKILQYFLDFEADGVFESTIMIFFSDHGARFGRVLHLAEGFLEERLPTMFIWLPPWFRAQYPEFAKALELNRHRLTSNYDLHMTLKHIVELGSTEVLQFPPAFDCPKCKSLFYAVPENRTCADAGISEHWCTCHPFEPLANSDYHEIPLLILEQMNHYFASKNVLALCTNLTLRYTHLTEYKLNLDDNGVHIPSDVGVYRVKFKVDENGADFQATVVYNNRTKTLAEKLNVETISRLDSYRDDSLCTDDKVLKKYCICLSCLKADN